MARGLRYRCQACRKMVRQRSAAQCYLCNLIFCEDCMAQHDCDPMMEKQNEILKGMGIWNEPKKEED